MKQEDITVIRKLLEDAGAHGRIACRAIYGDRAIIHADGKYFGIIDLTRKTWVD